MVTWGPNIFGVVREMAGIHMTFLKQSYEVLA